jgi:sulfite reductase (ferredoxin)
VGWGLLLGSVGMQLTRLSMACPALPLCGLAITEAERGLPDVNKWAATAAMQASLQAL